MLTVVFLSYSSWIPVAFRNKRIFTRGPTLSYSTYTSSSKVLCICQPTNVGRRSLSIKQLRNYLSMPLYQSFFSLLMLLTNWCTLLLALDCKLASRTETLDLRLASKMTRKREEEKSRCARGKIEIDCCSDCCDMIARAKFGDSCISAPPQLAAQHLNQSSLFCSICDSNYSMIALPSGTTGCDTGNSWS